MKEVVVGTLVFLSVGVIQIGCKQPAQISIVSEKSLLPVSTSSPKPTINLFSEDLPPKLLEAWKNFTADGRYRLAQPDDFKISVHGPCHLGWSKEFLAIVIDTTVKDSSRYKLVFFEPTKTKDGSYKQFWVVHDHDLSRTQLSNASSKLVAYEYPEKGGQKNSTLEWDVKKNSYTCIGTWFPSTNR